MRDECEQLSSIAAVYQKHGKLRLAENSYKLIIDLREKNSDTDSLELAVTYYKLAEVNSDLGNYSKARPLYTKAVSIFEKHNGDHQLSALWYWDALVKLRSISDEKGLDWEGDLIREA